MTILVTSIYSVSTYAGKPKDHPLISRFPGASINCYLQVKFDKYSLPLGKLDKNKNISKSLVLEGKTTQITYRIPADRSLLEVYKNYEEGLKNGGFEILFALRKKDEPGWSKWADLFFESTHRKSRCNQEIKYSLHYADEGRYLSAVLDRPEGKVYIAICMTKGN